MNREEVKKLLPIIQAFADGANVQMKNGSGGWSDLTGPAFNPDFEYRIKPEPMELWLIFDKDGDVEMTMTSFEDYDQESADEELFYRNNHKTSYCFGPYTMKHFTLTETP